MAQNEDCQCSAKLEISLTPGGCERGRSIWASGKKGADTRGRAHKPERQIWNGYRLLFRP